MTTHSKAALAIFSVALLSGGALTGAIPGYAADATKPAAVSAQKDAVAKATETAKDAAMIKTVDEAYKAMREIRAARLAIFNGSLHEAGKFVGQAKADMQTAQGQMKDFAISTQKSAARDDAYIPFDTSLALSEGFKPTAEKQTSLDKANQHLAKGEHKQAVEVLKTANIDVTVSATLLPANASLQHVKDAATLLGEKKYYEANLALKAVEDSVIVDAYSVDNIPVQGQSR